METAGVCAEATGTAASGAATEKARTIAATVRVRISVSFTKNPSQRETRGRDGGHRAHATWALDLCADSDVAAASAASSRWSKSSTWMSSMTLRSYSRNCAASVSYAIPASSACWMRPVLSSVGPVQLLLGVVEEAAAGPLDDREVFLQAALVLVMLEHHRGEVHAGQHVPEPRRQALLLLQVAAEGEHRHIDREGEGGGEAHDVLVVARGRALDRRAGEARVGERHDEGAHRIRDAEADVRE